MTKFFTSADGLKLAYKDEGDGLPVLCLSGLTRNATDFDYVAPLLEGVRLIRADYRGRGASDWSEDYTSYSIPQEATDALALMDHLGIDEAAILGTSRGGLISMFLAATAKDRLIGVCLNDIGPELSETGLSVIRDYLGRRPKFAYHQAYAAAMPALHPGFDNVPASRWLEEAQRRSIETGKGLMLTYDPKLRDAVLENMDQPQVDLWTFFDAFQGLPLALIRGANSDLLTRETADKMRQRRADMLFADVAGRGHVPFLDEPQSIELLNEWISQCR